MTQTINVTQQHIEDGVRGDPYSCPVAKAISKTLGYPSWFVKVEAYLFTIDNNTYFMPFTVRNFIDAYDNNEPVQPFSFVLE